MAEFTDRPLTVPVDLIEVGCSVWAHNLEDTDADAPSVKGGVVVGIETDVDRETGEVSRRFITATPWRGTVRFDSVRAAELKQAELPNTAAMRSLIRIAAQVVAGKKKVGSDVARCIQLQAQLMEAL